MKITSKVTAILAAGLSLGTIATGYCSALQGVVEDANRHVLAGAEIRIEGKSGSPVKQVATDTRGRYAQADLAAGTYHVSLIVNGQIKAIIMNVAPRENETEVLNFTLKRAGRVEPSAIGKHYVLLKNQTGTHIDRWAEVQQVPDDMSLGMQQRMRSGPDTVVRAIQTNSAMTTH